MPVPAPIQGITTVNVGSTITYTDSTPGGTWSTSDITVMTIDSGTGTATTISAGNVQIIYTVGSNATALSVFVFAVNSLTNGINYNLVYNALKNRILWRSQGIVSDSCRYYEDFHPLNNTDILDAVRPKDGNTLTQYLNNKQSAIILDCINSVYCDAEIVDKAQLVFYRVAGNQLPLQYVANTGQFVGLRINTGKGDYSIKLNSLQLFFSAPVNGLTMYLYNDMIAGSVYQFNVNITGGQQDIIQLGESIVLSNLVPSAYKGGTWYLGYYQSQLLALSPNCQAIYYPVNYSRFKTCSVLAFSANTINNNTNFVRNNIGANNLMYGMNLEISAFKDATNNIVQNAHLFDNLIGQRMTFKVIDDCKFSFQVNSVQQAIQGLGGLDELNKQQNGSPADYVTGRPKIVGVVDKINQEIVRVKQGLQKTKKAFIS